MPSKIYLLENDSTLKPMVEAPYDSERLLQRLLADYPDLLAGDQMNTADPRRWLLVTREMSVPDGIGGSKRWSLDHLFLDQDAIPDTYRSETEQRYANSARSRRTNVGLCC